MSDTPTDPATLAAMGKLFGAASIEDSVHITLTKLTPIPKNEQEESGPYFRRADINIPVKGLVYEEMETGYDNDNRILTQEHFDHLPEDGIRFYSYSPKIEYQNHKSKGPIPASKITLPSSEIFYAEEMYEKIKSDIASERDKQRKLSAEALSGAKFELHLKM